VPELTDDLVQTISDQSDQQSGHHSIRELERIRDDNLVSIMRGLKGQDWGAGALLNEVDQAIVPPLETDFNQLLTSVERVVPINWTDYNGHMNDSRYAQAFSDSMTTVMETIGADRAYVDSGLSYFTVDMRISYIDECHAGDVIKVTSKITEGEGKKLRIQKAMHHADGRLLSTCEVLLIHVDLGTRKSCLPSEQVATKLKKLAKAHKALPDPF